MSIEMTEEQKEMFDRLTPLQQKVCINSISGMSNIDSYINAGGKAKTQEAKEASASEILSNLKVRSFMDSIKQASVSSAIMSREEMLERLSGLARTNMSDLITWHVVHSTNDDGEEVEQSLWTVKESAMVDPIKVASISEVTAGRGGLKIKQHSPLAAMKQLAELAGYEAPKKTELSGTVQTVQLSKEEYADVRRKMLEEDDC